MVPVNIVMSHPVNFRDGASCLHNQLKDNDFVSNRIQFGGVSRGDKARVLSGEIGFGDPTGL